MLQTSSSLQSRLPRWRCEGKSNKTAPAPKEVFIGGFAQEHAYLEHGVASPMLDESDWQLTHASNLCTAGFLDIKTWPPNHLSRVTGDLDARCWYLDDSDHIKSSCEVWLEAGAGLEHFLLQILWRRLEWRLELFCSIFLYRSVQKQFIGCWSWFGAFPSQIL